MRSTVLHSLAIAACWVVWGLLNTSRMRWVIPDSTWTQALAYGMPDALIWALLTPLVFYAARKLPVRQDGLWIRLSIHFCVAILVAMTHALLDATFNAMIGSGIGFVELFFKILRHTFQLNILVYGLVVTITQSLEHRSRIREVERHEAELRARLSDARLAALEAQLRPHFLFNTLHTVTSLIEHDAARAQRVILRLSDLLRRSLREGEPHEVSLSEELDNVRAYFEIEKARFEDRLQTTITVDSTTLDSLVPCFVLQPLAENAVHHGISQLRRPGRIDITARRVDGLLELEVRDNGPGPGHEDVVGVGLGNTQRRLRELYGDQSRIEVRGGPAGGTRVRVVLPQRSVA